MAPAYKVEELLAMRDSVSESAVSIEKFRDEDSIKEHVLRPSASASGISLRPSASVSTLGGQRSSKPFAPMLGAPARSEFLHSDAPITASGPPFVAQNQFSYAPAIFNANGNSAIKKPSPTPSVRRNKAEQLLKEHGSPPGVRVTAGGYIVSSDVSPLGSPRYSVPSPHNPNAPNQAPQRQQKPADMQSELLKALPNGFVFSSSTTGDLFQVVDGALILVRNSNGAFHPSILPPNLPLSEYKPASAPLPPALVPLHPATAPFVMPANPMAPALPMHAPTQTFNVPAAQNAPQNDGHRENYGIDVQTQIDLLDKQYKKLEAEKRELEQTEVIQERLMSAATKAQLVERKKKYTIDLDKIRKSIKELRAQKDRNGPVQTALPGINDKPQAGLIPAYQISQAHQYPYRPVALPMNPVPHAHESQPGLVPLPNGLNIFQSQDHLYSLALAQMQAAQSQIPVVDFALAPSSTQCAVSMSGTSHSYPNPPSSETKDGQATPKANGTGQARRSHAVEIKDPQKVGDHTLANGHKSSLNPTSPSYKPNKPLTPEPDALPAFLPRPPPSPSPIASPQPDEAVQAQNPWLFENNTPVPTDARTKARHATDEASNSSYSTADFFPSNTAEHSFSRYTLSKENNISAAPNSSVLTNGNNQATPERSWPNTPWNSQLCSPNNDGTYKSPTRPLSPLSARLSSWTRDCNPVPESPGILLHAESQKQNQVVDPIGTPAKFLSISKEGEGSQQAQHVKNFGDIKALLAISMDWSPKYQAGYYIGLRRQAPGDDNHMDFMHGYCAGVLDSSAGDDRTAYQQGDTDANLRQTNSPSLRSELSSRHTSHEQVTPPDSATSVHFPLQQANYGQISQEDVHAPPSSLASCQCEAQRFNTRKATMNGHTLPGRQDSVTAYQEQRMPGFNDTFVSPPKSSIAYAKQSNEGILMAPVTKQCSENQMPSMTRSISTTFTRQYPGNKIYSQHQSPMAAVALFPAGRPSRDRPSQVDGAMDDLAEKVTSMTLASTSGNAVSTAAGSSPVKASRSSPLKASAAPTTEPPSSPSKSGSPKKSGGSPAKARLERVVDRVKKSRRGEDENKDGQDDQDPASMTVEEKKSRRKEWRKRFRDIKKTQQEEIQRYKQEHPQQ